MSILSSLPIPPGWREVPFGLATSRRKEIGRPDLEPLSVFLDAGVVPRSSREDNHNELGDNLADYLVVRPGDIVFNKLRTWQGGFGWSRHAGIVSPAYFVCEPREAFEPRFVDYQLHSAPYLSELKRVSKWQPPSQFDTSWEQLRALPLKVPSLERQHAIASFLDRESDRVRALRSKLSDLTATLGEALRSEFEDRVASAPRRRIRYGITMIQQGWSPECENRTVEPGEWGVLKLGCVNAGVFRSTEHKTLPSEQTPRPELEVHLGDLLMSRANSRELVGSAAVVHDAQPRLMLSDLLYRVRLHPLIWSADYIAHAVNSAFGRQQIEAAAAGAAGSMPKISQAVIRNLEVPAITVTEQREIVSSLGQRASLVDRAQFNVVKLEKQLLEYRDALITEAVTGQLDVSRVSDAQMDERARAAIEGELVA